MEPMSNAEFAAGQPQEGLSDHQRDILDFAKKTYRHRGKQEADILEQFGFRATTYFRRLNDLLSNPAAMEYDPITVKRHQRIVDDGLTRNGRQPRYSDGGPQ